MEKGGLADALSAAGLTVTAAVGYFDELRLGLVGTTRRRWGRRGTKIVQRLQRRYEWRYLALVVDGVRGILSWTWQRTMRTDDLLLTLATLQERQPWEGLIWDGAPAHHAKRLADLDLARVFLPAYSPELNPAERVFEEVRRAVEGDVYATLDAKQAAVDTFLTALAADPDRVRSVAGWTWIQDATEQFVLTSMS